MALQTSFFVRQAERRDLETIVALEQARFGGSGVEAYGPEHVRGWFEINPAGMVVAEREGRVVGYQYSQRWRFGFDRLAALTTHDEVTDGGHARATHDPAGNAWYGISFCSIASGAGRALLESIFQAMPGHGVDYFVGASRIPGFDSYVCGLDATGIDWRAATSESRLALFYAYACAKMSGAKIWPSMPPQPELHLPLPPRPDPVLNKHMQIPAHGMAAFLPGYIHDPSSRNYGVFLVYQAPSRP
jgi:hypothetical protein